MAVPRVYLETTIFNHYFDENMGIAHECTHMLFEEIIKGKYKPFTLYAVIDEIKMAPSEKRDKMINLISEYNINIIEYNLKAVVLADLYISDGILSNKRRTDALHIAIATVKELDIIISMNFKHIVRRKTRITTGIINTQNGYKPIEI